MRQNNKYTNKITLRDYCKMHCTVKYCDNSYKYVGFYALDKFGALRNCTLKDGRAIRTVCIVRSKNWKISS